MRKSKDVIVFWEHYLGTNLIPERMKKLIRRVLAVPIGSADVERAFSILSHIRDQRTMGWDRGFYEWGYKNFYFRIESGGLS